MNTIHRGNRDGRPARRAGVRATAVASVLVSASLLVSGCSKGGSSGASGQQTAGSKAGTSKHLHIAYFAFAQQNSYQAPQIAAAQKAITAQNADMTVFDANNNAQKQYGQVQDAIASGKYDGFMIDAVDGAGLVPLVKRALSAHIKVVALNSVLGPDLSKTAPQIAGVSASIVYTGYERGERAGTLVKQACASVSGVCNIGYMYNIKASGFSMGVRAGFDSVVSSDAKIKVAAEGQDFFTATGGLSASQTMLQAHPDINVFVGSDQGMAGSSQAIAAVHKTGKIQIVGLGGSIDGLANVKSGAWFGEIPAQPATQGKLAAAAMIKALRKGVDSGGIDPSSTLPDDGMATKANVSKFTGEWTA